MIRTLAFLLLLLPAALAVAQTDTLAYDGLRHIDAGELFLATARPNDEAEVAFNTRFTPAERCTVKGVVLGFGFLRFDATAPDDSLVVTVYEAGSVPPALRNVVKTFRVSLGREGVPRGNVDPQGRSNLYRGLVYVPFDVPVVFAPKRDFLIGLRFASRQAKVVDTAGPVLWSGATLVVRRDAPEYDRYRRYTVALDRQWDSNPPLSSSYRLAMYMRAVVQYDATLPDTPLTGVETPGADAPGPDAPGAVPGDAPGVATILSVAPQPFREGAEVAVALARPAALRLTLCDALGRTVAELARGDYEAGRHRFRVDAGRLGLLPGVYYLRCAAGGGVATRAVLRIR